jgi:hyperosmotically inducible protein
MATGKFTKLILRAAGLLLAISPGLGPANAQSATDTKSRHAEDKTPESLTREVHHQLLVLPFYSVFDSIGFFIEGRKVTLTGYVIRQTLKEHAEAAIRSIEGAGPVVNKIEVLPISTTDDELRRNSYRAIFEDATLAKYGIPPVPTIHIIVKNGAVILEGAVGSDQDKILAGKRAAAVANVSGVRNDIGVRKSDAVSN